MDREAEPLTNDCVCFRAGGLPVEVLDCISGITQRLHGSSVCIREGNVANLLETMDGLIYSDRSRVEPWVLIYVLPHERWVDAPKPFLEQQLRRVGCEKDGLLKPRAFV